MKTLVIVCAVMAAAGRISADGSVVKKVLGNEFALKLAPLSAAEARPYGEGFQSEGDLYVCENGADASARRGVSWFVPLNQSEAVPIAAVAMAKVIEAEGAANPDFSLYLDLKYMDGTSLWGQSSSFAVDPAAGWQKREVIVTPDKPVRSLSIYLLFRNRSGKVLFKEPRFGVLAEDDIQRFDGVAIEQVDSSQSCFMLRDVAAGSDFVMLTEEALGVRLTSGKRSRDGAVFYDLTLEDLTGEDRALTLVYTRPVKAPGLTWFHNSRRAVVLENKKNEVMNTSRIDVGSNGQLSRYPFGAVAAGGSGVALALDPATPVVFRIGCQPRSREIFIACDIGLAPEKPTAEFSICEYKFDPSGGFRSALARYYALYPEAFKTRVKEQGVWMPFAPISQVAGWRDFGFRFKEGTNETAWDDAHNILTFRYTEPMTWWMKMEGQGKHTLQGAEREARRLAAAGDKRALAWLSSAFEDERGGVPGRVRDTPWCNGVVWSMNSAPGVEGEVTNFKNHWNPEYIERQYGAARKAKCDGEYIDSAEAYVTDAMNFRRGHFAGMERPLCYTLHSRRVGVYKGMIGFEYIRALERGARARGHYMMANSTPSRWFWLAPLLDVMGTETDWNRNGRWTPMADEELLYRRVLCRGKPFCFLMNTDFSKFSYQCSEKFMRRCLAYGMFPGYFSADASTGQYFKRPRLYNRDRPLFKKYVPLCKLVAEAGWEPLTGAVSENNDIIVERFGRREICYLTLYNLSDGTRQTTLKLSKLAEPASCRELVGGTVVSWKNQRCDFELPAGDVRLLEFKYESDLKKTD